MNSLRSWRSWWHLVRQAASAWSDDYAPSMGAALSYYTVFSLAPLLLIVVSIAGLIFGAEAARGELVGELRAMMGDDAATAVQDLLASLRKPEQGATAAAIGAVILLIGATTVFGELQDALDRIWRAPARTGSGLWNLLRTRLLSFGMILGIAFLLMVSLVAGAAVSALGKWWGGYFGGWELLLQALNALIGFALATLVFALIYKLMPRVRVAWQDVWIGAAVTALLFTLGKVLIGLYIGKSGVASGFGAAGSIVIIFVWVFYSAQIFLLGAEFTWVYACTFGSKRHEAESAPVAAAALSDDEAASEAAAPAPIPYREPSAVDAPPNPSTDGKPADSPPQSVRAALDDPGSAPAAVLGVRPLALARPITHMGAGLALGVVLGSVLPRLLRRL